MTTKTGKYSAWRANGNRIAVDLVEPETGKIVKTRIFSWKRPAAWWAARGHISCRPNGRCTLGRV